MFWLKGILQVEFNTLNQNSSDYLALFPCHPFCLSLSVVSKVWQEQTVQRLLQLIELPLLDGVLDCGECPPSAANNSEPDILYTSNYLDREILKAFKESQ